VGLARPSVAQTRSAQPGDRTGPEFRDPARGQYYLHGVPLTLAAINLKPEAVASFLLGALRWAPRLIPPGVVPNDCRARAAPSAALR
jgi:hypothetical protein